MALTESQNPDRPARMTLAGLTCACPHLAGRRQRPFARAEVRRRRLPDPRVQRRPDLPVADPARALDGQLRVRHLRLCLDLVLLIGDLADLGLATAAQRFIPEYTRRKAHDLLRGFLSRSRWLAVGSAALIAAAGVLLIQLLKPYIAGYLVVPLSVAWWRCRSTRSCRSRTASPAPTTGSTSRCCRPTCSGIW